ncbi:MAG: VOC family protein [Holophagaceae bacterium]
MIPPVRALVPMAHVADVERSIRFYAHLGLLPLDTFTPPGAPGPTWAFLRQPGGAQLMVTKASRPLQPETEGFIVYLYTDDVLAMHARLESAGLGPGPIAHPFYNPKGEFRLQDPDGYAFMIAHT